MAAFAIPAITAGANLISGLFGSNAQKRAAKNIKNAADVGIKTIGDAGDAANKDIFATTAQGQEGVSKAVAQGQESTDIATQQANENVARGTTEANKILGTNLEAQQKNLSPYLTTGDIGSKALQNQILNPFKAPTEEEARATPGYKFRLDTGTQALSQQAAAAGALSTGGTLKALQAYGTGLADTYYQSDFNNAKDVYNTNTSTALAGTQIGQQASEDYNQATQNASNRQAENSLAQGYYAGNTGIDASKFKAGLGMTGSQFNATLGQGASYARTNNTINEANNAVNLLLTGAGAQSSGMIGSANTWSNAVTGAGNSIAEGYYSNLWNKPSQAPGSTFGKYTVEG